MVQFNSFYNDPNNRQILEVINTPTGAVTIFEPSKDDVNKIMQLKEMVDAFNQENVDENLLDINGTTILKELIPLLTDLEIDPDMTDEEMAQIIENPTVELSLITSVLSSVVTNIYTLMIMNFKNNLELRNMVDQTEEISDSALAMFISKQSKTDEGRKQIEEINKQSDKIVKMETAIKQAEEKTNAKPEEESQTSEKQAG
ncbi:hypothetical protein ACTEYT_10595 (plasmid) [Limosilactobacillus reuteri]|uniref:Uncharacterized protein n=2 Tax=Limosilactobacillus reuteri TaxID=1598 RepID=A0A1V4FIK0_LIMRT|nr:MULTISPECIES: hypothetical protein [Limosilactobacillus]CCC04469.1 conserved hypothetical protein [Limosilactobacillus reuteri subsp. suis]NMV57058.1 hypothetical protein [Limosilactobacillus reuteri]OPG87079.1 hypothetical protein B5D07_10975 [Limosilactobacillus reuteri]OTA46078.1 hypothetical protein BHL74_00165 [Limosilactobacillus reuteri]CUU13443.1 hypothetical protein LRATCC53608_pI025 [Limosilactobacillus reuteri subsp. suis]